MKFIVRFFFLALAININAQLIENGPMVGYSSMKEAAVWVQAKQECSVQMKYWDINKPTASFFSKVVKTTTDHANTAHLIADKLEPGNIYGYEIIIDNIPQKINNEQRFKSQTLWKWRGDAPDFKFVAGSCFYINEEKYDRPGKGYGGNYNILQSIHKDKPDFMVWLGDNTYLRESDWDSKSGVYHRYTHTRSVGELKALMANTHQYAIWDDHDYGPNDSDRTYYGKEWTKQAFKDFWANPVYGVGETEGITGAFAWNDADFFLMDNRWYRTPQSSTGEILGEKQMTYLIEALQSSNPKYKFVCIGGQVLNTVAKFENHAVFADERNKLLNAIDSLKIKGVIFLDGDRHHSELSKWTGPNGTTIYDVTSSSLTSGTGNNREEKNDNRVDGSMIIEKNYAVIEVVGPKDKREVKITYKDVEGKQLFVYKIAE